MIDFASSSPWLDRVLWLDHHVRHWLGASTSWPYVALLIVAILGLLEVARARVRRRLSRIRLRWQANRALDAEAWAARLLTRAGYRLIGAQVCGTYDLWIDDRRASILLRADYVVEHRGRLFVAEVKSGKAAPNLETAATRRQLLEYRMAFPVDGVLLVDGEAGGIHEVVFPIGFRSTIPEDAPR